MHQALEEGDDVFVLVRMGEGLVKRKPAKVVEPPKRGVTKIRLSNEKTPRVVRTSDIEVPEPPPPPPPPAPPRASRAQQPSPRLVVVAPVPTEAAVVVEDEESRQVAAQFEQWVKAGERLIEDQELELLLLDDEENALLAEAEGIQMQMAELQRQLDEMPQRRATLPARKAAITRRIEALKRKIA